MTLALAGGETAYEKKSYDAISNLASLYKRAEQPEKAIQLYDEAAKDEGIGVLIAQQNSRFFA